MKMLKYTGMMLTLLFLPISPSHARTPIDPTSLMAYGVALPMSESLPQVAVELCEIDVDNTNGRSHSSASPAIISESESDQARAGFSDATVESCRSVEIQVHRTNYLPHPNILYASVNYIIILADWLGEGAPTASPQGDRRTGEPPLQSNPTSTLPCDFVIDLPAPSVIPAVDVYVDGQSNVSKTPEFVRPRTTLLTGTMSPTLSQRCTDRGLPASGAREEPDVSLAKLTIVPTLAQNRPNPFNPATEIEFYLPCPCHVELAVFNIGLDRICTLLHETREAGTHRVIWDGTDDHGAKVASGIYLYRLEAARHAETKEMILLK